MKVNRILQIIRVFGLFHLDQLLPKSFKGRFLFFLNPWRWFPSQPGTPEEHLCQAFIALGPIFVKFGQALSTRRDLIPESIVDALILLQDHVPPFPFDDVKTCLETSYGKPFNEIFLTFDEVPLGSASIAQVHAVTLMNGEQAIVKLLRPNIIDIIRDDLALLYLLARKIKRYVPQAERLRLVELVYEFECTITDELDLLKEAANATQLRRNFHGSSLIYVPKIYWQYTEKTSLVMERITSIPIGHIDELKRRGTNLKVLAENGVEIFFTQVFRDSLFHADMHPGNIFVNVDDPNNPRYEAVDFGIMGTLSRVDQRYLAENLLAFFNRDYRRVAELHVESGWVPVHTRVDQFEAAVRSVCEPIFELPLGDISFAKVLLQLFQTASRFNMQIQPQLMLLQKTLFNIEGLGRELYPQLNLWHTAKPFLKKWLKQQLGLRAFLRQVQRQAPYWLEKLPELPDLIYRNLQQPKPVVSQQTTYKPNKVKMIVFGFVLGVLVTLFLIGS